MVNSSEYVLSVEEKLCARMELQSSLASNAQLLDYAHMAIGVEGV